MFQEHKCLKRLGVQDGIQEICYDSVISIYKRLLLPSMLDHRLCADDLLKTHYL